MISRRRFMQLAGLGAASLLMPRKAHAAATPKRPNFVFFLVDDLGWRDLGCFASTFYETPNVDRLAAQGMRFTNAYGACPVCSPTRASIMAGKYPARMNTTDWFGAPQPDEAAKHWTRDKPLLPAPYEEKLPLGEATLAEALRDSGYRTFFAGKWHLGDEGFLPEDQGFELNKGGHHRGSPPGGYFAPYKNPKLEDGPRGEHLPARLADETAEFIEANQDAPFLAYLSFYSVHTPLQAPSGLKKKYEAKALRRRSRRLRRIDGSAAPAERQERQNQKLTSERQSPSQEATTLRSQKAEGNREAEHWGKEGDRKARLIQDHPTYGGMVESMDTAVGTVVSRLDELGLADNTVVIFMSDNGGLSTSEGHPTSNLPLRAGKGWLYEGGIREPMIIKWPGNTAPGSVCDTPVTSTDFYPTMLEMAGLPPRPAQHIDGISLAPLLKGVGEMPTRPLYWHYPHYGNQGGSPGAAIRLGDWKLIEFFENGRMELYNLRDDLSEQHDLAATLPDKVKKLADMLHAWQKEVDARFPTPNPAGKG